MNRTLGSIRKQRAREFSFVMLLAMSLLFSGCSKQSSLLSKFAQSIEIDPPSQVVARAVSPSSITVSWTNNSLLQKGFIIERAPGVVGPKDPALFERCGTLKQNIVTFVDTHLEENHAYTYRVKALFLNNDSKYSELTDTSHAWTRINEPGFISSTPLSPSFVITPAITGRSSPNATAIQLYSDPHCTNQIGSDSNALFESSGVQATVGANASTMIYAKSSDQNGNESGCKFMLTYTHDNITPADPEFTGSTPASPSSSNNTPTIKGTTSPDTLMIILYGDSACSDQLGSAYKNIFETTGLQVTVPLNSNTEIYAKSFDQAGNGSDCKFMLTYTHDDTPSAIGFGGSNPPSPSKTSTTPKIFGTTSADAVTVSFFSDSGCNTRVGSGPRDDFTGSGVTATVSANTTTQIYGKTIDVAGNPSPCIPLTSYTHDDIAPADPSFLNANPPSPSSNSTPTVKGTTSADTNHVKLYSDSGCNTQIGNGPKALFDGSGVMATVSPNVSTAIYAKAFDLAGNSTVCKLLLTYIHDNIAPPLPGFSSTNPGSPSNTSITPRVIGTTSGDAVIINLFSDPACTVSIGSGPNADFISSGITAAVADNAVTAIYGNTLDPAGNRSACTPLTSYIHDSIAPADPSFLSCTPLSPSSNLSPVIKGTSSADTVTVKLYSDSGCSNPIGSGTKAVFESSGAIAGISRNTETAIYAQGFDLASNGSGCIYMLSYKHDDSTPDAPGFISINPSSTSNILTPKIIGTAPEQDAATINFFNDSACTLNTQIGSGQKADFISSGISVTVAENTTTMIYGKILDTAENPSACTFLAQYTHDGVAPSDPSFVSATPGSPSNTSTTPVIRGTSSTDTLFIQLFNDPGCSTQVGTGSRTAFESTGLQITIVPNTSTGIYAQAFDPAGNGSACKSMLTYVHDNIAPAAPGFSGMNPASPAKTTSPKIIGIVEEEVVTVQLFSDSTCSTSSGTGTPGEFTGTGITALVAANATTRIYAKTADPAGNFSPCTFLASYTHDQVAPTDPSFVRSAPLSPSSNPSPAIQGASSADTLMINLYSDAACSAQIGNGYKNLFESTGVGATVALNTSTGIYAQAFDQAGNGSACTPMLTYLHDDTAPPVPGFSSTNPVSPARTLSPKVIGSAPDDTVTVNLFSDPACATAIGSGTKAEFTGSGIAVTVTDNATTTIHGKTQDAAGNLSACTLLTSYTHDTTGPTDPSFTSSDTLSPSSNPSPAIKGTSSADTDTVKLYSDSGCSTQIGSGSTPLFESTGVIAAVLQNAGTVLYAKAFDQAGNGSACTLMMTYLHDNITPPDPGFSSANPASPSKTSAPVILGTAFGDAVSVHLFSNSTCTTAIGSGTKEEFTTGITVTVADNATTSIHGKTLDAAGNLSACTLLTSYTHDTVGPTEPAFTSSNPSSPSNQSTAPLIKGTASSDTVRVSLHNDSSCSIQIGNGTRTVFESTGLQAVVSPNASTAIYVQAFDLAGNGSSCKLLLTYVHDDTAPSALGFISTNPASPSKTSITPKVIGTTPGDAVTVKIFSDSTCISILGSGSAAAFTGSGVDINVAPNTTTAIYGQAFDASGNPSACATLTNYTHDNTAPANPVFASCNPPSPSSNSLPAIKGTSSADTDQVKFYSDSGCSAEIGSGSKTEFDSTGILAAVSSNTSTAIYAKAFDATGNGSICKSMLTYVHDNIAPPAPGFSSMNPSSPGKTATPNIMGTANGDAVTVSLFSDSACTTSIGSGTKANFTSSGITVTVSNNVTTTLYGKTIDAAGNLSACTMLSSYTHDNVLPADPAFTNSNPPSPSNLSTSPQIKGTSSTDANMVILYSNAACTSQLGSGFKAEFEGAGVMASLSSNSTTAIYAKAFDLAGNGSSCASMFTYVHDNIPPPAPGFTSTNPSSPGKTTTPIIIGTATGDGVSVRLFSDSACSTSIGSGSKSDFTGSGLTVTVATNANTTIYGKTQDAAENQSACTLLLNYIHDNAAPLDPSFGSSIPASPSMTSTTPLVKGTSSSDTAQIILYSDSACGTQIGNGSKATFELTGLQVTVAPNTSTPIHAKAFDQAGNGSACKPMFTYIHDNTAPPVPGFSSTNPISPSKTSTTPKIIGTTSADTVTVKLYRDSSCLTLLVSGTAGTFTGAGLGITVTANTTTTIYGKTQDLAGNLSACTLLTSYTNDTLVPAAPNFVSATPASPSSNSSPAIKGTSSVDTDTVTLYRDSSCSIQIGTNTKAVFDSTGVVAAVSLNTNTTIYARAFDLAGNGATCKLMTTYNHDNIAPPVPGYNSTNPASPSKTSTTPSIIGTVTGDATLISLFSDSACTAPRASGTKAAFIGTGISITVAANTTTAIYGKTTDAAGNLSTCTPLGSYTHDTVAPADPTFLSSNPVSPNLNGTPAIKGTSSADTATIRLYSNVTCTSQIGTNTKAVFESTGVVATVPLGNTTIYAKAFDQATNASGCILMLTYRRALSFTFTEAAPATQTNTPLGDVSQVLIFGSTLYAATSIGLQLLDFSDSSAPQLIGTAPLPGANAVAIYNSGTSGKFAFVGVGSNLYAFNVSDPKNIIPVFINLQSLPPKIEGMAISGTSLFVANSTAGLTLVDLRSLFSDVPSKTTIALPGEAKAVAVNAAGTLVAVAAGSEGTHFVDLSNPSAYPAVNPSIYKTIPVGPADSTPAILACNHAAPEGTTISAASMDVKISGNTAYVAGGSEGFYAIDITDPTALTKKGSFTTVKLDLPANALRLAIGPNNLAYFYAQSCDGTWTGIKPVNTTDPSLLSSGGGSVAGVASTESASSLDIDVNNHLVSGLKNLGLKIYDFTNDPGLAKCRLPAGIAPSCILP